jgi:hypothetical protein
MIRSPRTARSTGGLRRYREDYTQFVGGTLDAERRKICATEHEQPNFWTRLIFKEQSGAMRGLASATGAAIHPGGTKPGLERAKRRSGSDVRQAGDDPGTDILESGDAVAS